MVHVMWYCETLLDIFHLPQDNNSLLYRPILYYRHFTVSNILYCMCSGAAVTPLCLMRLNQHSIYLNGMTLDTNYQVSLPDWFRFSCSKGHWVPCCTLRNNLYTHHVNYLYWLVASVTSAVAIKRWDQRWVALKWIGELLSSPNLGDYY